MRQWRGSPLQERRRIRLTCARPIEATAQVHVSSGTRLSFVFAETAVGSKRIRVIHRFADRPNIGCSPAPGFRQDVTKTRALENAGVLSLQPMIEPGDRLDVKTLPRPREAMLSHHCNPQMLAVSQALVGREGVGQVERHILP